MEFDRPHLGAMQNTQNTNPICRDDLGCNVRRTRDNKLPGSGNSAGSTALGKVEKTACGADDFLIDVNRRPRIRAFNVTEDSFAIVERILRPD